MRHHSRSILASMLVLAFAGTAYAGSSTTQNLTIYSQTNVASAQDALRQEAGRLNLPADLGNLVQVGMQESILAKHYTYQQMLRGLPVDRATISVSITRQGQLQKIYNATAPISAKADASAANQLNSQTHITPEQALDKAWANMKVQHALVGVPRTSLVWVPTADGVTLAHKVEIQAQMPTGGFVQYIDAQKGDLLASYSTSMPRTNKGGERSIAARASVSGAVLDRASATEAAKALVAAQSTSGKTMAVVNATPSGINGTGLVFDPDPRTYLNTDNLTDTSPASAFDAAYLSKSLRDLTVTGGVYKLSGPFVNITEIEAPTDAPSTTTNGVWTAKRGNNAFDDTNVYFQLDQSQRYIQSLGFTGAKSILNRPLNVDTDGMSGDDNSHFSGTGATGYLAFGHGCVNDSEDADVILHEYGHGIQASINSSWSGGDTGGMGEGFGDYWAASYSYSTPNGPIYHPEWAFSWDGHGSCWAGRMLNRTDAMYNSSKTYGAHQSVTEGSASFQSDELWSTPLFQSLVALVAAGKPRANVDQIILEAHFGLGSGVKMPAMATAIVNAAHNLFPTDSTYEDTFRAKFQAQNILTGTVTPPPTDVLTKDVAVTAIAVAAGAGRTFTFDVPAGASNLTFKTTGGTGDADLYTKLGSAPTTSSYLSKSDGSTATETITVATPAAGKYYVLVQGYTAASGISLVASYSTGTPPPPPPNALTNNVPVIGIAVAKSASVVYTMVVPAGRPSLTFTTSGGTGDADLYVQLGSAPTTSSYLKRSNGSTTAESISITSPAAGTYYVMVYGYSAASGISLVGKN